MATRHVSLPNIGQVTLYKRRGNRSLRLSIGANGEVRVSLPYWLPYKAGEQFAASKSAWIQEHRPAPKIQLQEGHAIGKAHRICFEQRTDAAPVRTRVLLNEIRISYPAHCYQHDSDIQDAAHKASITALRKEASTLLPERLRILAVRTGYEYQSVRIKKMRSRWGSCNSRKEIALNLFLMQLPWELIDYVLVHELVHTKVMQHGAPFWKEIEQHVPRARALRKQIGAYQPKLLPITRSMT